MNYIVKQPVMLAAIILWIGFVFAISFMEAWLKFRAPGITLPLGLGIGKIVFFALNKVEWVLALIMIFHLTFKWITFSQNQISISFIVISILILQTFWLLPALDERAMLHIQGEVVTESNLHLYYVLSEVIKVALLITIVFTLFKKPL